MLKVTIKKPQKQQVKVKLGKTERDLEIETAFELKVGLKDLIALALLLAALLKPTGPAPQSPSTSGKYHPPARTQSAPRSQVPNSRPPALPVPGEQVRTGTGGTR